MATVTGFRTPEMAALDLELPLLGTLTAGPEVDGPVAAAWPADEELRRSATRIADRLLDSPLARDGSVGVLGDVSASCRAQVSAAIAAAMAGERTTVLIDADLRAAHLSFDDRRRAQEGLVDILRYGVRSPRVVSPTATPGLALLPVGSRTLDLEGTYGAEAVPGLFAELSRSGEVLIVNGPDVADVDAAEPLLAQVEGWILVHELGTSDPERTRALRDRCGRTQCVGILVVTGRPVADIDAGTEADESPETGPEPVAEAVAATETPDADELVEEALIPAPIASAEAPPPPLVAEPMESFGHATEPTVAPPVASPAARAPSGTADRIESAWEDSSETSARASRGWWWGLGIALLAVVAVVLVRGRGPSPATETPGSSAVAPAPAVAPPDDLVTPATPDEGTAGPVTDEATAGPSTGEATPDAAAPSDVATPAADRGTATPIGGSTTPPNAAEPRNSPSAVTTETTRPPSGTTETSPTRSGAAETQAPAREIPVTPAPPTAAAPAAPAPVPQPANPSPLGEIVYAVHLESVKAEDGATREAANLAQQGLPTFVHRTEIPDKGTWWRIYVGPYGTRDEAAGVAAALLRSGRDYAQVHKLKRDEVGR